MSSLVPCVACGRHVRLVESTCPFCGEARGDAVPRSPAALPADRSLSRAAVVLMGATALAACGKTTGPSDPEPASPTNMAVPAYGPPPVDPSLRGVDAAPPPPPPEASIPDASTKDASRPMAAPAYGPPPFRNKPKP